MSLLSSSPHVVIRVRVLEFHARMKQPLLRSYALRLDLKNIDCGSRYSDALRTAVCDQGDSEVGMTSSHVREET